MLSLMLKDGEYLTIGDDIVIQVFTSSTIKMSVQAPRDMTILRGEVLERNGESRPACLRGQRSEETASGQKGRPNRGTGCQAAKPQAQAGHGWRDEAAK